MPRLLTRLLFLGLVLFAQVARADDDAHAFPFPAGPNAALVKATCSRCHAGALVTGRSYSKEEATDYYARMTSEDPTAPEAQKIITYLSTVLGDNM